MNQHSKKTIAIIQARMDSSRLPGKVLRLIDQRPMLSWVYERASRAHHLDQVIIATTIDSSDDTIESYCQEHKYPNFRGSSFDVLDRFYQTANSFNADIIVRLTADCPFIDADEIDNIVEELKSSNFDFVANRLPPPARRTYPIGIDIEACPFNILERAWKEAQKPHQREHVMPYLYENDHLFRIKVLQHEPDYGNIRITVDTEQDLELARLISKHFPGRDDFSWLDIVKLLNKHPEFSNINANVHHKNGIDVDERMTQSSINHTLK